MANHADVTFVSVYFVSVITGNSLVSCHLLACTAIAPPAGWSTSAVVAGLNTFCYLISFYDTFFPFFHLHHKPFCMLLTLVFMDWHIFYTCRCSCQLGHMKHLWYVWPLLATEISELFKGQENQITFIVLCSNFSECIYLLHIQFLPIWKYYFRPSFQHWILMILQRVFCSFIMATTSFNYHNDKCNMQTSWCHSNACSQLLKKDGVLNANIPEVWTVTDCKQCGLTPSLCVWTSKPTSLKVNSNQPQSYISRRAFCMWFTHTASVVHLQFATGKKKHLN